MIRLLALVLPLFVAAPAQAVWRVAQSEHFVIYSENKPETLARFATDLERFDAAIRYMRGLKPAADGPNNRLTIFQVPHMLAVQRMAQSKSRTLAGFYQGRAGQSYAFVPRRGESSGSRRDLSAETILLHEYAHHFMYRNYRSAFPLWFSEGWAEFNAAARSVANGAVDLGLPAQHRAHGLYAGDLPIETLLTTDGRGLSPLSLDLLYGRGWLLTHYLHFARAREGQLARYLAAINEGRSSLDAAKAAFGDLTVLDRELDAYRKAGLSYLRIPAAKIAVQPVRVSELSPGAQALMPVHMQSRRGVDDEEAKKVVRQARAAAAPYPNDPFAQLALAEAEIDAGEYDAADRAADTVLAADPASVPALIFKGRVAMHRLKEAKSADPEAWKQARRWFTRANRADPNAPEPLMWFYESFNREGVKPTANAVTGLEAAAALAPEDDMLRINLAYQYLADGRAKDARATLAPAAFNPHGGPLAEAARRVIAALDLGGTMAGLKAWSDKGETNSPSSRP
mgnify:CR=1 FL=1